MAKFTDRDETNAFAALDKLNFDRIEAALAAVKPAAAKAAAKSGKAIPYCAEYCAAKPVLVKLLPVIAKIPVLGPRLKRLIDLLMRIADTACDC